MAVSANSMYSSIARDVFQQLPKSYLKVFFLSWAGKVSMDNFLTEDFLRRVIALCHSVQDSSSGTHFAATYRRTPCLCSKAFARVLEVVKTPGGKHSLAAFRSMDMNNTSE